MRSLAVPTGVEPATFALTGRRANQTALQDRESDGRCTPPTTFQNLLTRDGRATAFRWQICARSDIMGSWQR